MREEGGEHWMWPDHEGKTSTPLPVSLVCLLCGDGNVVSQVLVPALILCLFPHGLYSSEMLSQNKLFIDVFWVVLLS